MIRDVHSVSSHSAVIAGVRVRSNRPLTGLAVDGAADLGMDVRFEPPSSGQPSPPESAHALPGCTGLEGWIAADGRHALVVEPRSGVPDAAASIRIVVPFASALQGEAVLHASAVSLPAGVHAFVAASGAGKSTLAAHLAALGAPVVADDLMACRTAAGGVMIPFSDMDPHEAAHRRLLGVHFLSRSRDVDRACFVPLTPAQCVAQLLWNGFSELAAPRLWKLQFESCARIAQCVPSFALRVPDDRGQIGAIAADVHRALNAQEGG